MRLDGFGDRAARPSCPAASGSASRWPARSSTGPKVLLLDEPLGALDLKLREQMQVELKAIQREVGITFVFVTHDQEEALTMSDRIAVFNDGRIEQVGTPGRGLRATRRPPFVAGFVGTSNLLDGDAAAQACSARDGTFAVRPEKIRVAARRRRRRRRRARRTGTRRARSSTLGAGDPLRRRPRRRRPR